MTVSPLPHGPEWDFELLERYDQVISQTAAEFGLDTYPNQIEIINSEQMLDAYASAGLPLGYPHWSYGKAFIRHEQAYRKGYQGLAYEIVINSSPCIAYLMEENSLMMQALVIAHASYGHNSFFKGNYLFKQFTQADAILDYLVFARRYVMECEQRYGMAEVEELLDSSHALMEYGVDRYKRPQPQSAKEKEARRTEIEEHERRQFNDLWRTLPQPAPASAAAAAAAVFPEEPEENVLYFVEKHSPRLAPWQRELVRIVRKLSQYFYPQTQTKVMNEGWATFWHYTLINRLYEKKLVDDAFMLEFLHIHTNVVSQRGFDQEGYHGMNPYALGFAMMQDIRRICEDPTEEDTAWFPELAGTRLAQVHGFRDAQLQGRILHRAIPVAAPDPRHASVRSGGPRRQGGAGSGQHPRRARLQARAPDDGRSVQAREHPARHSGGALRARRRPLPHAAQSGVSRAPAGGGTGQRSLAPPRAVVGIPRAPRGGGCRRSHRRLSRVAALADL